jgi:arylsulfatase A-like enzyme
MIPLPALPRPVARIATVLGLGVALPITIAVAIGPPEDPTAPRSRRPTGSLDPRPNILLIVADDLGYADLGSFGSEIRTPNLDRLAARGLRFAQFHTAPMCAPTRAMLLSGNNNHVAGMGSQSPTVLEAHLPGYEGHLSDRVAPMPRLLRDAGYHTFSVGKWHLGTAQEHSPPAAGFERSYQLMHGAANHFNEVGFFEGGSLYREDGVEVEYPAGTYTTELFTDRLIEYIDARLDGGDGRPFFGYAAYTSPHWPLQVPDAWLGRYRGRYDDGYDVLRERNFEALRGAGIIPAGAVLPPRNEAVPPWESLPPEEKRREAREMELYAAMVENLDHHVGRLLDHLERRGVLANTLVVFMSDNGAAGSEDFYYTGPYADYLRERYDNAYENMGRPDSWVSYGAAWAEAGSAPFRRYKTYTTEGGIVAPMIVAGPGVRRAGEVTRAYATVMDVAPTLLELAGAPYPTDGSVRPMIGESMAALLAGEADAVHDDAYVTALYHRGRAFVRKGRWKLTNLEPPFDPADFELYDLVGDPGETVDLSGSRPEVLRDMLQAWDRERRRLGIILPSDP